MSTGPIPQGTVPPGGIPVTPPVTEPPITLEPVRADPWQLDPNDSNRVRENVPIPYKYNPEGIQTKVLKLKADEIPAASRKAPTLALAVSLFQERGIELDPYNKFNIHNAPQIVHIGSKVDEGRIPPHVTVVPPEPAQPKYFAGEVTFSVTVSIPPETPDGKIEFRTIEFTQTIETTVEIPHIVTDGDRTTQARLEHEAKGKTLALLHAYAGVISNNEALIGHNDKIVALTKRHSFHGSEVRESTSKGFYGRALQWHREPPSGLLARINYAFEKHGSVTAIKIDGYSPTYFRSFWNHEIPCEHLEKRNREVNALFDTIKRSPHVHTVDADTTIEFSRVADQDRDVRDALAELKNKHRLSETEVVRMLRKDLEGTARDLDDKLIGADLRISAVSLYNQPPGTIDDYLKNCNIQLKEIARLETDIARNPAVGANASDDPRKKELDKAYAKYDYFKNSAEQVYNDIKGHNERLKTEPQQLRALVNQAYAVRGEHTGGITQHMKAIDEIESVAKNHYIDARFNQFDTAYKSAISTLEQAQGALGANFKPPRQLPALTDNDKWVPTRAHFASNSQKTTKPPGYTPSITTTPPPAPAPAPPPVTALPVTEAPPPPPPPVEPEVTRPETVTPRPVFGTVEAVSQANEMRKLIGKTTLTDDDKNQLIAYIGTDDFNTLKPLMQKTTLSEDDVRTVRTILQKLNTVQIGALEKLLPNDMGKVYEHGVDIISFAPLPPTPATQRQTIETREEPEVRTELYAYVHNQISTILDKTTPLTDEDGRKFLDLHNRLDDDQKAELQRDLSGPQKAKFAAAMEKFGQVMPQE